MQGAVEGRRQSERDDDRLHVPPRRTGHNIFTGSRKIAKNQGKLRWVIKEAVLQGWQVWGEYYAI